MATRRMISNSLGDSEKFSGLANDTHRLAYVLLVTWADAEGRFLADAVSLRGKLFTRLPWTADVVEAALLDLHDADLVRLYAVGKHRYGVIVGFHEHNTIRRKGDGTPRGEAASRIPPPPEEHRSATGVRDDARQARNTGATPEQHRTNTGVGLAEVEVESEDEGKGKARPQHLSAAPTRVHPQAFVDTWNDNRGRLPSVQALNGKRRAAVTRLVKEYDGEALALFRDATLAVAGDDYWVEHQYGFDNLMRPGRVLEKAEKFRAGGAQLGTARVRMLARADRWAAALPDDGGS